MTLVRLDEPPALPVSLELFKQHARIDHDVEDDLIRQYLAGVTGEIEGEIGRVLVTQRWELRLDCFAPVIELPLPPCQGVESIVYLDAAGVERILDPAGYRVSGLNGDGNAEIARAPGTWWPATQNVRDAVRVTFTAGYQAAGSPPDYAANVPAPIISAILELAATRYQWREAVATVGLSRLPESARRALLDFRVWSFG